MSYIYAENQRNKDLLYLVKATIEGNPAWYYIQLERHRREAFLDVLKQPSATIDLKSYGQIIKKGWGEHPPAHTEEAMKRGEYE